jgi:hypothetical protein
MPQDHPLPAIEATVDEVLTQLWRLLDTTDASIDPPERSVWGSAAKEFLAQVAARANPRNDLRRALTG